MKEKKYLVTDAEKLFDEHDVKPIKNHKVFQNLMPLPVDLHIQTVPIISRIQRNDPKSIDRETKDYFVSTHGDAYANNFPFPPPENLSQAMPMIMGYWQEMDIRISLTYCLVEQQRGISIGYVHVMTPIKYSFIEHIARPHLDPVFYSVWEIQYWLNHNWHRKGIMTEAVQAVVEYFESNGIAPLMAKTNLTNTASQALLKKFSDPQYPPQVIGKDRIHSLWRQK